jgi:hypothetical protein
MQLSKKSGGGGRGKYGFTQSHSTYDHYLMTSEATPDREGIDKTHTREDEIPLHRITPRDLRPPTASATLPSNSGSLSQHR